MSLAEFREASIWILDHFVWLKPAYNDHLSLLQAAQQFMRRPKRKFAVALDPWNTLEHLRPRDLSETEYVGQVLTSITNWCREKHCHIFIVAHPAKLARDSSGKRPVPTPYDVSGSAHWYNKADNVITVHRDQVDGGQDVDLHVQKVRFKHIGRVGVVTLKYDPVTGRYFEFTGPTIRDVVTGKPEQYIDPQSAARPPVPVPDLDFDPPWEAGRE
jgi:twinkle protein